MQLVRHCSGSRTPVSDELIPGRVTEWRREREGERDA